MLRAARLTFRMHRFEVFAAVAVLALMAVSALVVRSHLIDSSPPVACWQHHWDRGGGQTRACEDVIEAWWPVTYEAGFLTGFAAALPMLVAIFLAVPVVGREIEMRTASLAWSLSGDRRRWLLARFLPMLVLALVALPLVGFLLAEMVTAAEPWNYWGPGRIPRLDNLGTEGPSLVGRALMALGIGLLSGAVIGRTLPGFVVAAAVTFGLVVGGGQVPRAEVAKQVAVWVDRTENDRPDLYFLERKLRASDGRLLTYDEASAVIQQECPRCEGAEWVYAKFTQTARVAPLGSYPAFERSETAASIAIGGAAILLTFPIVARRRPS